MPDLAPTVRAALDSPLRHKPSLLQSGIGAAPRCCSGSFAEQVAGDVQNGEAPTPFWERLQIGLDKISTVSSLEKIWTRTGALPN
jgi:hypothetical protein